MTQSATPEEEATAESIDNDLKAMRDDLAAAARAAGYGPGVSGSARNYEENVILGASRGFGFAAEKANHLFDKYAGKDARIVGGDNATNGADRLVDNVFIQTKYCSSGSKCISQCFEDGVFRYMKDGAPMQIEVPSDMYESAVQAMKERIRKNQVPKVTNPDDATRLVRKGHITYAQARNIAKFGTIESITYDAVNGIQLAGAAMGLTAAVSFAMATWNGDPWEKALENACLEGLSVGGTALISSVITAQLGRTGLESSMRAGTDWAVRQMGPKLTAALANAFRTGTTKIYGAAAANNVSKLLRGNVVTGVVVTVVLSVGDFADLFMREISAKQALKNVAKTGLGVAGGAGGMWAGAAAGTAIFPGAGTIVGGAFGLVGGIIGGSGSSIAAGYALDALIDDDDKALLETLKTTFGELASEYLLNPSEAAAAIAEFNILGVQKFLREMHASGKPRAHAATILTLFIEEQVRMRKHVKLPSAQEMAHEVVDIVERSLEAQDSAGASGADQPQEASAPEPAGPAIHTRKRPEPDAAAAAARRAQEKIAIPERPFSSFLLPYESIFNKHSDVYCGARLAERKGQEKIAKGRKGFSVATDEEPIFLVDATIFGSVEEGIFVTETHIYGRGVMEKPGTWRISDHTPDCVFEMSDTELHLGFSGQYLYFGTKPTMLLFAECLKRYLTHIGQRG